MLEPVVPAADAVDGELLEVAKPLLLLGWSAPAALVTRVAIESTLKDLLTAAGLASRIPEKAGIGELTDMMYRRHRRALAPHAYRGTKLFT